MDLERKETFLEKKKNNTKNNKGKKGKRELWRRSGETTAISENKKEHGKKCILFPAQNKQ